MTVTLQQIKELPKVLLHEHLDGGIRPSTIIKFAQKYSISLPDTNPSRLGKWFVEKSSGSLEYCIKAFDLTGSIMQTSEALEQIAYEALEDAAKDNIVYAEIRFCPYFHTKNNLSISQVMDSVIKGFNAAKADFGIEYGLIICAIRSLLPEINHELAKLTIDYFGESVVGFDVAGLESGFPLSRHRNSLELINSHKIPITIHAGEVAGIESIYEAMEYNPHRISHVTSLLSSNLPKYEQLVKDIKSKNIHLEINLTSNLVTGAIENLAAHPFIKLYQQGFNLALNTDDTLMFNNTLSGEYYLACQNFSLGLEDIHIMNLNAINSAFASDEKKNKCKSILK